jgi:dTDP-4-dehydrorhamnose reductase
VVGTPGIRPRAAAIQTRGQRARAVAHFSFSAGTLGRAFARICRGRALDYVLLGHCDVDIADLQQVEATILREEPWAVINAAGYVRLDAAEHEPARCRRGNTIGAELLARTCARHGLPLATFSSDLVFDGAATRPYVESDPVGPLSVYGKCKADAERLVVAVHAHALVVRTSTLFGTADPTDPLHEALDALARGVRWDWRATYGCRRRMCPTS